MGSDVITIDFNGMLDEEQMAEIEAKVNQIVQVLNRINTSEDLHHQLRKLSDSKHQAENITQLSYTHD